MIRGVRDLDEDFETEKYDENLSESCIIDSEDVNVDDSQDEILEEGELREIKDEKDENTQQLHGNIIFRCIFCTNIEFSTLEQLNSHDEEFHKKGGAYTCIDECYFTSREKKQIVDHFAQNHVKNHINNKNKHLFYCIFCDIGFEAEDEYKKHEQEDHFDGEKYSCPKCDFHEALRNKVMDHFADEHKPLVRHRSTGGMFKQQLYYCSKCSQAFYTSNRLKKHLSVVHSEGEKFVCQCGKSFSGKAYLQTHMKIHSDEKLFKCDVCDKGFKTKFNLKAHAVIHDSRTKEYGCNKCGHLFLRKQIGRASCRERV